MYSATLQSDQKARLLLHTRCFLPLPRLTDSRIQAISLRVGHYPLLNICSIDNFNPNVVDIQLITDNMVNKSLVSGVLSWTSIDTAPTTAPLPREPRAVLHRFQVLKIG